MDPRSAAALVELGGDPSGFRSRPMTLALADDADLVLTVTRRQRRATLEIAPHGLRRTFTMEEAADLLTSADLSGLDRMSAGERARHLSLRLDAERAWRATAGGDDIEDPIGRRMSVHHQVADAIATALRPLSDVLVRGVFASQPR